MESKFFFSEVWDLNSFSLKYDLRVQTRVAFMVCKIQPGEYMLVWIHYQNCWDCFVWPCFNLPFFVVTSGIFRVTLRTKLFKLTRYWKPLAMPRRSEITTLLDLWVHCIPFCCLKWKKKIERQYQKEAQMLNNCKRKTIEYL